MHRDGKAMLNQSGTTWVAYQVWEPASALDRKTDLIHLHGVNDYGGKVSWFVPSLVAGCDAYRFLSVAFSSSASMPSTS